VVRRALSLQWSLETVFRERFPSTFEEAPRILKLMGTNVVRQGGPGAGEHTKLCNQITRPPWNVNVALTFQKRDLLSRYI